MTMLSRNSVAFWIAVVACARSAPPGAEPPMAGPPLVRHEAPNPRAQAVWQAVLELYASETLISKASALLEASRRSGAAALRTQAQIILVDSRSRPYSPPWLDSLAAQRLIAGACSAFGTGQCRDSVATSFLSFGDPSFTGDTAADVEVEDRAVDPHACQHRGARVSGGIVRSVVHLARYGGPWRLIESSVLYSGDHFC